MNCPFEIPDSWIEPLSKELTKLDLLQLAAFVEQERSQAEVYPPQDLIFNALKLTPYDRVRVVIVGQDPYHGKGQAHGLAFSVPSGVSLPPSLRNIYKELALDLGVPPPENGSLISWAEQGVLLLNTVLTVREGEPMSHQGIGWEEVTGAILASVVKKRTPVVFLLWGNAAKETCKKFEKEHHVFLCAAHPSPLSAYRGFFGSGHFSKTNEILRGQGLSPILWS